MIRIGVVLVAGGSGRRMGNKLAKQFISINNKPILQHSIDLFYSWNRNIQLVLVLPEDQVAYWKSINDPTTLNYTICNGGKERFHSVKNGLDALDNVDYVMVHDSVRPLVSHEVLDRCLASLQENTGVIPVVSPTESVRIIDGDNSLHLDRNKIRIVQTPQCFHYDKILDAYKHPFKETFTDDASVFEAAGNSVALVEGNYENIKITTPGDLEWANIYLKNE